MKVKKFQKKWIEVALVAFIVLIGLLIIYLN